MEIAIHHHRVKNTRVEITEENMRKLFSVFKEFVIQRNIPECKQFIDSYVEKVLIFLDHIEVTYKVALFFANAFDTYRFNSKIKTKKLYSQFSLAV